MAIELHTGDSLFPHDQFLHDKHILPQSRHLNCFNINPQMQGKLSGNGSNNLESPWDSPNSHESCWDSTYDIVGMLEKMKLDERDSFTHRSGYGIQNLETSKDVGVCSYRSLLHDQIRESQLSQLRQEQIQSMKEKQSAYRENHVQISKQFQNNGRGVGVGWDHKRTTTPWHTRSHQQPGSEMPAIFLGGSSGSRGTYCGTGVFLPRGRKSVPSESRKRPGKGCSTVLIPARVVQALQLHFDQMSGPKTAAFPPLHDVLVSNRDGMYSLQKRQSRKKPAHVQNEMVLPQEWTY